MSDNEDAPVVRRPTRAAPVASDSDSDGAGPVARRKPAASKKTSSDSDSEDEAPVASRKPKHVDPAGQEDDETDSEEDEEEEIECPTYDYDAMTEQEFLDLLKAVSAKTRQRQIAHRDATETENADDEEGVGQQHESHFDKSKAYTYSDMLDRVLAICRKNNPDLSTAQRIKLPMPLIERGGAKKTAFSNFADVCKALGRSMEDVKDFVDKNLSTTSAIDSNNVLMIRVVNAKTAQFEKMLDKYVEQYCRCNACGTINTELARDHAIRLQVLKCRVCQATRHIRSVEAGFRAIGRGDRNKEKLKKL